MSVSVSGAGARAPFGGCFCAEDDLLGVLVFEQHSTRSQSGALGCWAIVKESLLKDDFIMLLDGIMTRSFHMP